MVSGCKLGGTINQTGVKRRQIEKIKNTTAVSFFFLFSAPALLAARGSPLTARSIAQKTLGKERYCSQSTIELSA